MVYRKKDDIRRNGTPEKGDIRRNGTPEKRVTYVGMVHRKED